MNLKQTYFQQFALLEINADQAAQGWCEIERSYTQCDRHYHHLGHLQQMLQYLLQVKLQQPTTVLFALFYHDVVYDAQRQDNEWQSSQVARQRMQQWGFDAATIQRTQQLILATAIHEADTNDLDMCAFLDADLAILGQSPDTYRCYVMQIRQEYACYTDDAFLAGRSKFIQHMLNRPTLFATDFFRAQLEAQARTNLQTEWEEMRKQLSS